MLVWSSSDGARGPVFEVTDFEKCLTAGCMTTNTSYAKLRLETLTCVYSSAART